MVLKLKEKKSANATLIYVFPSLYQTNAGIITPSNLFQVTLTLSSDTVKLLTRGEFLLLEMWSVSEPKL